MRGSLAALGLLLGCGAGDRSAELPGSIDLSAGDVADDVDGVRLDAGSVDHPVPPVPPVTLAEVPPPPISGGTLLWAHDHTLLVAADSDRDMVHVVDAAAHQLLQQVDLEIGCEPGRLAEGTDGLVHVACRRSGDVVTLDPVAGAVLHSRPACANPRGIAVDARDDSLLVACAEGVLTRMHADGTTEVTDVGIELRDVVDPGPPIRVSTFRDPGVLTLNEDGSIAGNLAPRELGIVGDGIPNTARRTLATADGGWVMLHQAASILDFDAAVPDDTGWSGGGDCFSAQTHVITRWSPGTARPTSEPIFALATAFDLATTADGALAATVGHVQERWAVTFIGTLPIAQSVILPCDPGQSVELDAEPTSVVFDADANAWVQAREPAQIIVVDPATLSVAFAIDLGVESVADTGHDLFHRPTGTLVACVSCHPEGREDGLSWSLNANGRRRSQPLNVDLAAGEPFHWAGDMEDIEQIFDEVRVDLMRGDPLSPAHSDALERWIFALPTLAPSPRGDAEAIARGEQSFVAIGCASCHSGDRLSNEQTVVMGEHLRVQVPTLRGVAFRPPYLLDGRAPDLGAAVVAMLKFSVPGGPITGVERDDIVAYLGSL